MRERKEWENRVFLMTRTTEGILKGQLEEMKAKHKQMSQLIGDTAGGNHDWHDNFPYEQACRDAEQYAVRIAVLEKKLKSVEIIRPNPNTESVGLGNKVTVRFLDEEQPETLTVLGPDDSGKQPGWISYESPVGKAIMGKKPGERISYRVPHGSRMELRILEILPGEFE